MKCINQTVRFAVLLKLGIFVKPLMMFFFPILTASLQSIRLVQKMAKLAHRHGTGTLKLIMTARAFWQEGIRLL